MRNVEFLRERLFARNLEIGMPVAAVDSVLDGGFDLAVEWFWLGSHCLAPIIISLLD